MRAVRLTFRSRLMVLVGVAATALALLIATSEITTARLERQVSAIQEKYLPKLVLEPELDASFEQLKRGFQDAVAAHDAEALQSTRAVKRRFLDRLERADGVVTKADAEALRAAMEEYDAAAFDVSQRLIRDETGESLVEAIATMQSKQARAADILEKATAFDRHELSLAFAAVAQSNQSAREYRLAISAGCLALVLTLSIGLSRSLLRSVRELTAGFERFGDGRFKERIAIAGGDEWGDLADHANRMAASLERSTAQRERAEERFRALVESAPDATVIVKDDGTVSLVNAQTERLFGYERSELVGGSADVLLAEKFRQGNVEDGHAYLRSAHRTPEGENQELLGKRKDGSEFPIEIRSSALETEDGAFVSSAIRDVTERRHIEAALKASNQELEAFSYSVAHDLRAPLRGINGLSRALLEDASDKLDAGSADYLARIGAAAERMGLLIDALLSLSRVSRVELQGETVNLSQLAASVATQLRLAHPERVVEFTCEPGNVHHGDPALLRAVLDNLLGNAWKFTGGRPDARVAFGAERTKDAVIYFVRDNGAGFDMAYADKLFAPFQRLHNVKDFAGTGIGLATVQRIVHRHGGRIWAESAVKQGATFYFTLGNSVARRPS
jgi:PAS domain S-box-containing protein